MRPLLLLAIAHLEALCLPAQAQSAPWAENPVLRRSFLAGYGVNSDIEPELSQDDRMVLAAVQPVIEQSRADAIRSLEKYVGEETNARFDLILANLYLEQQRLDPAVRSFQQAIRKFPNFRAAHKNLALAFMQMQRYVPALEHLSRAVQLGEADGSVMGLIGQCHLTLENGAEAETAFRYAAFLQPSVLDWKRGAIAALVKQQRFPEAIGYLETMIARDPDNREFLVQQAQLHSANEDHLKAAELLEVLALDGRATGDDLLQLGDIYVHSGLPRPAVQAYQRAVLTSDKYDRLVKAAEVMADSGALVEAGELSRVLQERFDEGPPPIEFKKRLLKVDARIAAARQSGEESIEILRELTATDPLDGDAWLLLGKAYQEIEDPERAIFAYERAAGIEAFRPDANLRLAQIYVSRQEFSKAVALVEEAQRLKPRDSVARYLDQLRLIARSKS